MRHVLGFAILISLSACASAAVYEVGAGKPYARLASVPTLVAGDEVRVSSGVYAEVMRWRSSGTVAAPILIRGVGATRPVIDANLLDVSGASSRPRAAFQIEGSHVVVDGFEFRNSHNGHNGAGVRLTGAVDVTVRNCRINACDSGIMSDGSDGVLIDGCEIWGNGTSDGLSHNIYLIGGAVTLRGCYIHHALGGQNVKTRAHEVRLLYNRIEWSDGGEVCLVDDATLTSPPDSNAILIGNRIVGGTKTSKYVVFGQDVGARHQGTLYAFNNTFIASYGNSRIINGTSAEASLVSSGNIFVGSDFAIAGVWASTAGSGNWTTTRAVMPATVTGTVAGTDPGFVDAANGNLLPRTGSPCVDIAPAATTFRDGSGIVQSGAAAFEYVDVGVLGARPSDGRPDAGAYERRAANTPPTIAAIADLTVAENAEGSVPIVVGDRETAASDLVVTVSPSDHAMVPLVNCRLGGAGANRWLAIRPADNATGTTTLTVTVSDGNLATATTMRVIIAPVAGASSTRAVIEVTQNGVPIAEGATVTGVIDARVVVTSGVGQDAQLYANLLCVPFREAGGVADSASWTRTASFDSRRCFDGENLLSVHVRPRNVPGQPYVTGFTVATFKLVTANGNPAPNGDRLLPTVGSSISSDVGVSDLIGGAFHYVPQLADDSGATSVDDLAKPLTVLAYLGECVLGRTREPFMTGDLINRAVLRPFQTVGAQAARVVLFACDGAGRANYGYAPLTIPALTPGETATPMPEVRILGLAPGGTLRVASTGTVPLQVEVTHLDGEGFPRYSQLTAWIGNRVVGTADLRAAYERSPRSLDRLVLEIPVSGAEVGKLEAARPVGESTSAFPIWVDIEADDGRSGCLPTTAHVQLNSVRTTARPWPYDPPTVAILRPGGTSGSLGANAWPADPLTVRYDAWGAFAADVRPRITVDGVGGAIDADFDGSFALPALARGRHALRVALVAGDGTPLPFATATQDVQFDVVNRPPVAAIDRYAAIAGRTLRVPAAAGVLANDSDPDGDPIAAELISPPVSGWLALAADGSFAYAPAAFQRGTVTFTYVARDADRSAPQSVVIDVSAADGSPAPGWPCFGGGPSHAGAAVVTCARTAPSLLWSAPTPSGLNAPAIAGGLLFDTGVGRFGDFQVACIDAATGVRLWTRALRNTGGNDDFGGGSPAVGAGDVVVQRRGGDAATVSLDAATGAPRWATGFASQFQQHEAPTVAGGTVFACGGFNDGVIAYREADGVELWEIGLESRDHWTPTWWQNRLFSWDAGTFREHDLATGAVARSLVLPWAGTSMRSVPAIDAGRAVIRSSGAVYAVDLATFTKSWEVVASGYSASPAVQGGELYVIRDASIERRRVGDGSLLASIPLGDPALQQIIVGTDSVIASSPTETYLVDRASNAVYATIPFGGAIALVDGRLYVADWTMIRCYAVRTPPRSSSAVIVASSAAGPAPLSVHFDASRSTLADAATTAFHWDFGDGTLADGATADHVFATAGTYRVALWISDATGSTSTATTSIAVSPGAAPNVPPVAAIVATPTSGTAPAVVVLDGRGSSDADGRIVAYDWRMPDGTTRSGAVVSTTMTVAGSYPVSLTVTDDRGGVATKTITVPIAAQPADGRPGITIEVTAGGVPVAPGATVTGIVDATITVYGAIGQHVQAYGNFLTLPFREAGHSPDAAVWSHSVSVDTRRFFDGENLLSVHVHPHNVAGQPYTADFAVQTFLLVSANANPAPNGDRTLPTLAFTTAPNLAVTTGPDGDLLSSGEVSVIDDSGTFPLDRSASPAGPIQVIAHLGESVLGRFRWIALEPPFADDRQLIANVALRPFERDTAYAARVVLFFADGAGRANYAFSSFQVPARSAAATAPPPILDARILDIAQGDTLIVPDGGALPVRVQVTNPYPLARRFSHVSLWLGNRSVSSSVDLVPLIEAMPTAPSYVVELLLPASQVAMVQAARAAGDASTAGVLWVDLTTVDGRPSLSSSTHIHLNSVRTASTPWPYGQPTIVIRSPRAGSADATGGAPVVVHYEAWGPLPAGRLASIALDGGAPVIDATFDGAYDLGLIARGSHALTVRLVDAALTPLTNAAATATLSFTVANRAPIAPAGVFSIARGRTLNVAAAAGMLARAADPDGDALTAAVKATTAHGVLALAADGSFTYTPSAGYVGGDRFVVAVGDGHGGTTFANATILVTADRGAALRGDWVTYGNGATHVGYQAGGFAGAGLTEAWARSYTSGGKPADIEAPAIAGGRVYASLDGIGVQESVVAIDARSGALIWQRDLSDQGGLSATTYADGAVYALQTGSVSDRLIALDCASGAVRWTAESTPGTDPGVLNLPPIVVGGHIYGGSGGPRQMYASTTAGVAEWRTSTGGERWAPASIDGRLFSFASVMFIEHDPADGTPRTTLRPGVDLFTPVVNAAPVVADGRAYLRAANGLIAVDLATMDVLWRVSDNGFIGSPSTADGIVYIATTTALRAYDGSDGTLLQSVPLDSLFEDVADRSTSTVVTDDVVIVSGRSVTRIIDRASFAVLRVLPVAGVIAVANDALYVTSPATTNAAGTTPATIHCFVLDRPVPTSRIVVDRSSGIAPLTCRFDGSGSTAVTGAITAYAWSFGDGSSATGAVVDHVFAAVGSYLVTLVVTDDHGDTGTSTTTVTVSAAPALTFGNADIGAVGLVGSTRQATPGVWTVRGGGADIGGVADACEFARRSFSGDVQITARVDSLVAADGSAKAGVMIRDSLDPTARYAFGFVTPQTGTWSSWRDLSGTSAATMAGPTLAAPVWLRVARVGATIATSTSSDGVTWRVITQRTQRMSNGVYIGLAVTAHDNAAVATAVFSNVTIIAAPSLAN